MKLRRMRTTACVRTAYNEVYELAAFLGYAGPVDYCNNQGQDWYAMRERLRERVQRLLNREREPDE